jgi:tRNA(fMet)-specific endonuclease VapC
MYCFDTNVVIEIFRGNSEIRKKVEKINDEGSEIFITPITLCELYKGVYSFHNVEKGLNDLSNFISSFNVLDFNSDSCKEFGKMYSELKKSNGMIPEPDLMILSIAKTNGLIFVTMDKKHFSDRTFNTEIQKW